MTKDSTWPPPRELMTQNQLTPLHQLGQNFLCDPNIQRKIIEAAELKGDEAIIEIGPGTGALTQHLVKKDGPLFLIELDTGLARSIREKVPASVEVVQGDVLLGKRAFHPNLCDFVKKHSAERKVVIISNLPYPISTPFTWNLFSLPDWDRSLIMVQKEFYERLVASHRSSLYSPLGVMIHFCMEVKKIMDVSSGSFWPRPSVGSCVIHLRSKKNNLSSSFEGFLRLIFGYRRKTMRAILKKHLDGEVPPQVLEQLKHRAEELSPELLLQLHDDLQGQLSLKTH